MKISMREKIVIEDYLKKHGEAALKNGSRWLVWDLTAKEWKVMANKRDRYAECVYNGFELDKALEELAEGRYYVTEE